MPVRKTNAAIEVARPHDPALSELEVAELETERIEEDLGPDVKPDLFGVPQAVGVPDQLVLVDELRELLPRGEGRAERVVVVEVVRSDTRERLQKRTRVSNETTCCPANDDLVRI